MVELGNVERKYYSYITNYISRTVIPAERDSFFTEGSNLIDIVKEKRKIALLGSGGIGKSVELRQLAAICSNETDDLYPILIPLNIYVTRSLFQVLDEYLPGWENVIPENLIIILDGLDEVGNEHRESTIKFIQEFINLKPKIGIVLSCRQNFYIRGKDDSGGTIEGLYSYYLKELDKDSLETYISSNLGSNKIEFLNVVSELGFFDILNIPFYLIKAVDLYKRDGKLPNNKASLLERLFLESLQNDINHYKNVEGLEEIQHKIIDLLERIAVFMEVLGKSTLTKEEYEKVIPDSRDRNILEKCSLWKKADGPQGKYTMFEHKNFQEYLAAKSLLKQQDFSLVKSCISFPLDNEKLIPSWVNTLSFLIGMLEPKYKWFEDLFQWLCENNPETIAYFERDRIDANRRDEVLKNIFNHYKEQKTWLPESYDEKRIANFCQSPKIIEFLVKEISEANHYTAKINAMRLLSYMEIPIDKRGAVRATLLDLVFSEELEILQGEAFSTLARLNLFRDDIQNKIINTFNERKSEISRKYLYKVARNNGFIDNYIEILTKGIKIFNERYVRNSKKPREYDDFKEMKILMFTIKNRESLETILRFFIKNMEGTGDFVIESESIDSFIRPILFKTKKSFPKDPNLLSLILEVIEKLININLIEQAISFFSFFEETGTKYDAFLWFYVRSFRESSKFTMLINEDAINFLIGEYEKEKVTSGEMYYYLSYSRINDAFRRNMMEKLNLQKQEEDYIDKENVLMKRSVDLLFNRSLFVQKIVSMFQHMKGNAFSSREIIELELSHSPDFDYFVGEFLHTQIKAGINQLQDVIEKLESLDWDRYILNKLHEYMTSHMHSKDIELSIDQIKYIEQWCYKTMKSVDFKKALVQFEYKDANGNLAYFTHCEEDYLYLWFFMRKFNFEYPEDILLELLSFDMDDTYIEGRIGIEYLESLLDIEFIYERIWCNIEEGIEIDVVLENHLKFCYKYDVQVNEIIPHTIEIINNPKRSIAVREVALDIYFKFRNNYDSLLKCLHQMHDKFKWRIVDGLFTNYQGYHCEQFLLNQLKSSFEYDKLKAAGFLIYLNNEAGLEYFVEWLKNSNYFPDEKIFNISDVFKTIKHNKFLPNLFEALKLTYIIEYENSELRKLIQDALVTIGIQSKSDYLTVKENIEVFIKQNSNLDPIYFLYNLIEILEKQFIVSNNIRNDTDTAIQTLKKLQMWIEPLDAGVNIENIENVTIGDVLMGNSRKIGDISNNIFGNNTNFQGDDVRQSTIEKSGEFDQAFASLLKDITEINDDTTRDQAQFFAEQLKEAYKAKDNTKAQTVIGFLKGSLGTAASLAGVARFFGLGF